MPMRNHLTWEDRRAIVVKELPPQYICTICGEKKPISQFPHGYYDNTNGNTFRFYPVCKDCKRLHSSVYLGVTVTEKVLSKVFPKVERMPHSNHGYDFICGKGYKVDAKSSCIRRDGGWSFNINYNKTADYFACLAFDNRRSLNPLYFWLLPGQTLIPWGKGKKMGVTLVNDCSSISIYPHSLEKWKEYEKPIDKVLTSCNVMKSTLSYFMRV